MVVRSYLAVVLVFVATTVTSASKIDYKSDATGVEVETEKIFISFDTKTSQYETIWYLLQDTSRVYKLTLNSFFEAKLPQSRLYFIPDEDKVVDNSLVSLKDLKWATPYPVKSDKNVTFVLAGVNPSAEKFEQIAYAPMVPASPKNDNFTWWSFNFTNYVRTTEDVSLIFQYTYSTTDKNATVDEKKPGTIGRSTLIFPASAGDLKVGVSLKKLTSEDTVGCQLFVAYTGLANTTSIEHRGTSIELFSGTGHNAVVLLWVLALCCLAALV